MARDLTIRVTGQNPDGSINVQQVGGGDGGNPFMQQSSGAMVPYNPAAAATTGYRAKVNGVDVTFATEADYLKAEKALREMAASQQIPNLGGSGGAGGGGPGVSWLRTGGNAAQAIGAFLHGRNIRRKLSDLDDTLQDSRQAMLELDNIERTNSTLAPLIPTLRRLFQAERDATESSVGILEDQLTAVDIQTGGGIAAVAADLLPSTPNGQMASGGGGGGGGGGLTGPLIAGGVGLGVGMLLSSNNDRDRDRRRR